jgi:predicted amidohydrolase YtcJ
MQRPACVLLCVTAGVFGSVAYAATTAAPPDAIYVDARVWTGDPSRPEVDAIAVADGRITAVGASAAIRALAGPATQLNEMHGRRIIPGFNDAHWHLPSRRSARLDNAGSVAVIRERTQAYAQTLPSGAWIVGRGWVPTDFPDNTAHRKYLDDLFPDRPVVLRDRDGHQALANSKALALAGVASATPDPEDGRIERDASGQPTGLLKEAAARLVTRLLPDLSADDTHALLLEEMSTAAGFGLTSLQDATEGGLSDNELAAVTRAIAGGEMLVRYRATVPFEKGVTLAQLEQYVAMRDRARGSLLTYGIAKGMLDGTVDARTAVMLEPYVGGGNGLAFWSVEDLDRTVAAYDRAGIQVQLHAIGDGAIRMALDAYEFAARVNGTQGRRHRVEHIEVPATADVPRFKELGVVASTQGTFATPDASTLQNYAPLLGPERCARANSFKQFDDAGAVQAFGTDYPVYSMNPLLGLYAAVTRQTPAGTPAGGWYSQGRIGVEAALRHYTSDAAYASFEEDVKGTLAVGKYADFVVLSDDILHIPPQRLLDARVLLTVMGGRVTYRANAAK